MSDYIMPNDFVGIYNLSNHISIEEISRFDPIAFYSEFGGEPLIYIKRILAVPNDRIIIESSGLIIGKYIIPHDQVINTFTEYIQEKDTTVINASEYISYLYEVTARKYFSNRDFDSLNNTFRVPDEYYFVVGDNYYESMDSRFWGLIHKDQIIGKVLFVL